MKKNIKLSLGMLTVLAAPFAVEALQDNTASAANVGWQKDARGVWHYYTKDSKLVTNSWVGDYYLDYNGNMATNRWINNQYYVGNDGKWIKNYTLPKKQGWIKESGVWYHYVNNIPTRNKWVGDYYLGSNGVMATNAWVDNGRYYVGIDGAWVKDAKKEEPKKQGWVKENGIWYHYEKGVMTRNAWKGDYWLGSNGVMATNAWVDNGRYYVGVDGAWVKDAKKETSTSNVVNKDNYKVVDISEHNGNINFSQLKNSVDGVIIRVGYGTDNYDRKWKQNVEGAIRNGIPFGFYWYSYALNESHAKQEVDRFLSAIKNYKPEYPIFIDMEDADYWKQKQGREHIANSWAGRELIIKTHINAYEKAGYFGGVYASKSWFDNMSSDLNKYTRWVAHWTENPTSYKNTSYGVHQYTSKGRVSGINGNVDVNTSWVNYPSIIKNGKFNGWK